MIGDATDALKMNAAECAFLHADHGAGPEWRETVYDEDKDVIEDPVDDGGRHRLWVAHTVKDRQWGYNTRLGAAFDLGRLVNYVADFVDYNVRACLHVCVGVLAIVSIIASCQRSLCVQVHVVGFYALAMCTFFLM
jgi:predicted transcriptional regulator